MKLRLKLSIIVIAILVVVVGGLSTLILTQASSTILSLSRESAKRLASQQASYWEGREENYLKIATITAGFMGAYEGTEPERRRQRFNQFMMATLKTEPRLVSIFAVFKPNSLDGMDSQYRGTPGSTAEGIYAPWFVRKTEQIEFLAYDNVSAALDILNGPNARKQIVKDPIPQMVNGKETYTFCLTVPVIDTGNNEVIGLVGVDIRIDAVQGLVEKTIKEHSDISAIAVYSDNGTILGSFDSNRIGKNMLEADDILFGSSLNEAYEAVKVGKLYRTQQYSSILNTNLEIILYPFTIGESSASWSIMLGIAEAEILSGVTLLTRVVIIIAIVVAIIVAIIIFFVIGSTVKPIINVATTLKDISEGEGDLTKTVNVHSRDEIGDLARYFNATLEKIKQLVITIKNQAIALFDIGNELASNMTETAAAINEITANIQSIKGRVLNQSASVTETNATMEQITVNIDKLNGQVENQTSSVAKSSSAIEEMIANINSVTQTLAKNAGNVQDLL
ncbi:MAG: methyl-accepting chemotaxis protein, partial [Treponema sp.]|nr:methyl-accepting chemotaxis protein [Treponema sp.]